MSTRTQKAKWNISTSLLAQIASMICGLIVPRIMIKNFGSELNGAATSITNFLAYISLIEGGIAGVARAALYKPLAENDTKSVSEVYNQITRFFRVVGCIFIGYTVVLAGSYKFIANDSNLGWTFSFSLVLVISISTLAQYFLGISNSIIIQADQRLYINNILSVVTIVVNTAFIVVLTRLNCSIVFVKLVSSFVFILRPLILAIYVKRQYVIEKTTHQTTDKLNQKWTALGQHIAYFLHSNTDVVVLTIFANLKVVSVYSIYYMIVTSVRNLTASFYNGIESVFGNLYAKGEHDKLNNVFGYYETLISFAAIILFSSTAILIVPFVKLYTTDVNDVNYIIPSFGLIAVLGELIYTLRIPYHHMVNAANRFKQTRFAAYGEAGINIILSIALVFKFGITGVAIATLVAMIFRSAFYAFYLSKHILHRSFGLYVKRNVINGITFALIVCIGLWMVSQHEILDYFQWFICGVIVVVFASILTIVSILLFYRSDLLSILKRVLPRSRSKS